MGITALQKKLRQFSVIALDTAPVIYFVEANPVYEALAIEVFRNIDRGKLRAVTSMITLTETLVHPFENQQQKLAEDYKNLLLNTTGIQCCDITEAIAEKAASFRAKYSNKTLKTPDAIQLATAVLEKCDAHVPLALNLYKARGFGGGAAAPNDLSLAAASGGGEGEWHLGAAAPPPNPLAL